MSKTTIRRTIVKPKWLKQIFDSPSATRTPWHKILGYYFNFMTISEARHFDASWRRILIMYNANTDAQWMREAERACFGIFGGMA